MKQKKTTSKPADNAPRISERVERGADILEEKTPNAQRPTPNVQTEEQTLNVQPPTSNAQLGDSLPHLAFLSAVRILEKKILMSSSVSLRIAAVFVDDMIDDLQASRNHRRGSFNSLRQIFDL